MKCRLIIKDEVNVKIEGLDLSTRKTLINRYKMDIPGARYLPAVRLGRWDGKASFFQLSGATYINLLPEILQFLVDQGFDIELDDQRDYKVDFQFDEIQEDTFAKLGKVWPKGHPAEGKPVVLRDYQVAIINNFLTNQQCLQEIATGAGKCRTYDSTLPVTLDANSDFAKLLKLEYGVTQMGHLSDAIEEYYGETLENDREREIRELGLYVDTPSGKALVNYFIKKTHLTGIKITLVNGVEIKCAHRHILRMGQSDIYANDLRRGDRIETRNGSIAIARIEDIDDTVYYDIGIDAPHLYYDADGVIHHNTLMTAGLSQCVEQYGRSIVVVPNKDLVKQTEADYRNLGLDVGVYFGDRKEYNKTHTICTWQSLNNMLKKTKSGEADVEIGDFIEGVVCVIVDEVHMAKAAALKELLTGVMSHIPIRWGLTGTVPKDAFEFMSIRISLGDVVGKLSASELQDQGVLASCHVNIMQLEDHAEYTNYQSELKYLLENQDRMAYIASMIEKIRLTGNTLVLVDRIGAGTALASIIEGATFVNGTTKADDRKEQYDDVATSDDKVIVATYGVAAVGINIPRIFNLVLIEPGKSFVRVIQSIGRGIRKAQDKDFVQIWDITSTCKFAKRHLTKRKTYYKDANYPYSVQKVDWK